MIGRATGVATRVSDTTVSRAAKTRLRMIRRLVFVVIIVVGLGIALSQFDKLNKLANAVLASSAVIGLVLGFAAQKILANPLAGILLAITQPIRIGDSVTIEDETGRVDDLTLSHTFIDTGDGRLMIVPNEIVVTNVVVNRSTGDLSAPAMVSRLGAARRRPRARPARRSRRSSPRRSTSPRSPPDGVRIEVHGPRRPGGTRASGEEAALRERAQRALREAGCACTGRREDPGLGTLFGPPMTARQRRRHRRSQGARSARRSCSALGVAARADRHRAVAGAGLWVLDVRADAPSIDTLKPVDSGANSQVFAADGTSLGYVQSDIIREPVGLDEIPKVLQKATIAIEDENFYEHDGVDYGAIVRAAVENVEAGEVKQGGSTITQQLVRNLYIDDPEDTIERKIIEAEMAREYEEEHTKNRDPRAVPEHRLLRDQRRQDRGRRRGRRRRCTSTRTSPTSTSARRRCSPACRRRPPDYNPFINPERRRAAPQPGARRDGTSRATSASAKAQQAQAPTGSGSSAATATSRARSSTSSTSSSRS